MNLVPEDIKKDLTGEQFRLYKLIWSRFLACQMSSAVYDSVTIEAMSSDYRFRANHTALKFSGYTAVYVEGKDEEEEEKTSPLPDLKEGEPLTHKGPGKRTSTSPSPPPGTPRPASSGLWRSRASAGPPPTPPLCPRFWTGCM